MASPSQILIAFSPEQFIYFIIAIVTATAGIILWVYRQTHGLDKRVDHLENNMPHVQKELDEQRPKIREMELLLARLTERLTKRIRRSMNEEESDNE
jgi:hypothetical protein